LGVEAVISELPAQGMAPGDAAGTRVGVRRVLFALPGLHRVNRGAEVAFESLASHLARVPGMEVTLAGSGGPIEGRPYRFVHVPARSRERFGGWPKVPPLRSGIVYEDASFALHLWRAMEPGAYEATVTCAYPFTNWALRARRRRGGGPAHLFVTQNGDWPARALNGEFRYFGCDGLVCTNPEYLQRHRTAYRCALIPNGVDTSRFSPGAPEGAALGLPEGPVVLIVAALTPYKRVREGIEAAARVPGAAVVVAGDGPLRDEVERTGRGLLGERFRRVSVAHDRMPALYRSAGALLHMRTDEPFGNIYLEAMSAGVPVVAHDNMNSRWIVGAHGRLVDTRDPGAVAGALRDVLSGDSAAARGARREMVGQRFAWPIVAAQYARFIDEVAGARAAGA
jgi:glycosyltransferase involved in cell wall biosynthesis